MGRRGLCHNFFFSLSFFYVINETGSTYNVFKQEAHEIAGLRRQRELISIHLERNELRPFDNC